jgi:hypothetical protein
MVSSGNGSPIGGVAFFDGTSLLGTHTLDASGAAVFSTVSLLTGQHSMTARYYANRIYAGIVSLSGYDNGKHRSFYLCHAQ